MAKKNYYVVLVGRTPGIYTNWEDCKAQVNGFKGSKYKGFKSIQEGQRIQASLRNGQQRSCHYALSRHTARDNLLHSKHSGVESRGVENLRLGKRSPEKMAHRTFERSRRKGNHCGERYAV